MANTTTTRPGPLSRHLILIAGGLAYAGFHAAFLTMISFLNGGPLPFEAGPASEFSLAAAVGINLALVALFGVQHAVMARPAFKRAWCRIVPTSLERSIFVVATVACLFTAMICWQSISGAIFQIEQPAVRLGLYLIQAMGWGTVVLSTFLIDHFELFGLRQVWCAYRGTELPVQKFRQPFLYRYSRHPMMVGMIVGLWATPDLSVDRLIWAAGFTLYVLLGTRLEERDLVAHLGDDYRTYQEQVPRFVGRVNSKRMPLVSAAAALVAGFLVSGDARASDGVIEINQASALAGGITVIDAPGFPITIATRGSYRLTSELNVPANTHGIEIQNDAVSIDLNGFTIFGGGGATGDGIRSSFGTSGTRIENGSIRNMGHSGVSLSGRDSFVKEVAAIGNGWDGIRVSARATIRDCQAFENGNIGISALQGLIHSNQSIENGATGISASQGVISSNMANRNGGFGIAAGGGAAVMGNFSWGNTSFGISGSPEVGLGNNVLYANADGSPATQLSNSLSQTDGNLCAQVACP